MRMYWEPKILLDRKPYIVIGVMPRDFEFPLVPGHLSNSELWVPMSFTEQELTTGRHPGTSPWWDGSRQESLQRKRRAMRSALPGRRCAAIPRSCQVCAFRQWCALSMNRPLSRLADSYGRCSGHHGCVADRLCQPCRTAVDSRHPSQAPDHAADGPWSTRWHAAARGHFESLLLSITGGLFGLGLAAIALRVGVSLLPETLPRIHEIRLDGQVVLFAILLSVLTGIVCGLAPAFAALRTNVNETLKEGGRTVGGGHAWLRTALVSGEIAIALVLLAASGLLLRSFEKMLAVDLGFRPDHVLTASYSLPQKQYATQRAVDGFNQELIRRLRQLPGVKFAGLTSFLPASGGNSNTMIDAEGYVVPQERRHESRHASVGGG